MLHMEHFFKELKRRRVYGVAVGYVAFAWVVLQVAELFLGEIFNAPTWVLKSIFVAVATGFPLALILSWIFDLKGYNLQRTSDFDLDLDSYAADERHRLVAILITDVVAHEQQLLEDKHRAIQVVQQLAELVRSAVRDCRGTVVSQQGDKSLSLFRGPTDALRCALNIYPMAEYLKLPPIRIGISMGNVSISEGSVYGKEIGITERVMQRAESGGIVLSGHARQSLPDEFSDELFVESAILDDSGRLAMRVYTLSENVASAGVFPGEAASPESQPGYWKPAAALLIFLTVLTTLIFYKPLWWHFTHNTSTISSIGVIPFANLSESLENEHFADGLTEELIFKLSRIPTLKVPSRTLSFALKDLALDHKQIAERMNVDAFVEGTARFGKDTVKLTVQLISTSDGFHLWANEYEAPLAEETDVIRLHKKIAVDVVDSLKLAITDGQRESLEALPTRNYPAWSAYMKGQAQLRVPKSEASLTAAEHWFEQALEMDPNYARAWAGLCKTSGERYHMEQAPALIGKARAQCARARELDAGLVEADLAMGWLYRLTGEIKPGLAAFQSVLERQPENVEAHVGMGWLNYMRGENAAAENWFDRALDLAANDPFALKYAGIYAFFEGQLDVAKDRFQRVVDVQPFDAYAWSNLGAAYLRSAEYEKAREMFQRSVDIEPTFDAYHNLGDIYYRLGDFDFAAALYRKAIALAPDDLDVSADLAATLYVTAPGSDEVRSAFQSVVELANALLNERPRYPKAFFLRAYAYAHLGKFDQAVDDLERALRLDPADGTMHYYAAVVYTLAGDKLAAFHHMNQAMQHGFPRDMVEYDHTLLQWRNAEDWSTLFGTGE